MESKERQRMSGQNNDEKSNKAGSSHFLVSKLTAKIQHWAHGGANTKPDTWTSGAAQKQALRRGQMIVNKDAKATQWRTVFATSGFGKKEHTHAEECSGTLT